MAENQDSPPTLASLRLGLRGKRSPRPTQATLGLLFTEPTAPPPTPKPTPAPPQPIKPAAPHVWTVGALVSEVRRQVESAHTDVWVAGEISNLRPAPSGHLYFTLKDGEAQLPVVLFRRQAQLLRFRPKDGDEIRARGRISIYESRGQLQLIAETLELRGAGLLQAAFERLRDRLKADGLFDTARKRPLPAFPKCIGVITSTSGAVIRDIVTVARRRHGKVNLLIYNATMQGPNCPPTVIAGLRWFNKHPERADLILIARGGGSAEDLAGFNDESLARAIAASTLPVVSAIGHETDFTIADFVADLRAPTPSAAAEIITSAQHRIEDRLEALSRRALRAIRYTLMHGRQRYARLSAESVLNRLRDAVSRRDQRIDDLRFRLESASARRLRQQHQRLAALESRLHRQDIRLRLAEAQRRLAAANARLTRISTQLITTRQNRLTRAEARLQALSPLAVLNRGYALVYSPEGKLLRNAHDTETGQPIRARLATGSISATVTEILPR
ncbi:exodeoxyribonuclease VII large subunit [Granulicella sibirica]|uniref:Exodeoxyribonuclease 7 large subunit n=1 Tax=Granulicella sibirica TaxID=2479048 RepID=A0A4Q0T140_9BACT|nr:exodeoxyribonuclease VII large subunit [Granulicella sibirica]RXH55579.1 Exodeoxyribonuclease VII large subunit [Granulicella sibirica]